MWKHTTIALIALTALAASAHARPSHPHDVAKAAIGGIITGAILSELIDDGNVSVHLAGRRGNSWHRYDSDFRDYNRHYRNDRYDRYDPHNRAGYHVWENRKVWIPGHWDYTRDRWGNKIKIWVKGHYETRRVKVWVRNSYSRNHRPDPYCR